MTTESTAGARSSWKRTHTCGELRGQHEGTEVILDGWVHTVRDHGALCFLLLRDRYGLTQVSVDRSVHPGLFEIAVDIRPETVVAVAGTVAHRPEGNLNPAMPTGEIEVLATSITVLGPCEVLPLEPEEDLEAGVEVRLQHRYLDLRRQVVREPLLLKAELYHSLRCYLHEQGFLELETPVLTRTTPEGAREFIVPSRLRPGHFYSLAQSPQLFKQLYMCAGFDRYAQIVKCFRDEDFRADRQPEFTQLDLEMSFVDEIDVQEIVEGALARVLHDLRGVELPRPVRRMTYAEAMLRYGTDKPDLRFAMEIQDLGDVASRSDFKVFTQALAAGGAVRGLVVPGGSDLSRKAIDQLTSFVGEHGARGLAWCKIGDDAATGPMAKFFAGDLHAALRETSGAGPGDLLLVVADAQVGVVEQALGALRCRVAADRGQIPDDRMEFLWVTDFPLLEWDSEEERWLARHHPFTSPQEGALERLEEAPGEALARAYDLVLNGSEIAGGSIRIHRLADQERVFRLLGIGPEEAQAKFGFLLEALRYGAPPHGGIALGLDRLAAILAGRTSIRDVIPFPKTARGTCPLTGAPAHVAPGQLREARIAVAKEGGPA
jgi:aspartyl-tRNA synthetase